MNLQSQYALQNNQYPKTISKVTDVLTNHKWDDSYKVLLMKKREQNTNNGKNDEIKNKPGGAPLAQTIPSGPIHPKVITCFCCREKAITLQTVRRRIQSPEMIGILELGVVRVPEEQ